MNSIDRAIAKLQAEIADTEKENASGATEASKEKTTVSESVPSAHNLGNAQFAEHGTALLNNGYLIIPIKPGHKRPLLDGWQKMRLGVGDLERYGKHGVGVLCGQGAQPVAAIDIDTMHGPLAARFAAWCHDNLGATCERVGNAPKTLLVYHAGSAGWGKKTGAWFEDNPPRFDTEGKAIRHRIEVLGNGQQFVAYHIHPDTGEPYEWVDFFGGLEAMRAGDLPVITEAQVEEALQVFEAMAEEAGLVRVSGSKPATQANDDPLMAYKPPVGMPIEEAKRLTGYILDNEDYDTWRNVGMSLHHEFGGSDEALNLWDEWSSTAGNYVGREDLERRWVDFGKSDREPVTAATLIFLAGDKAKETQIHEFYAYLPAHQYLHRPTRAFWPAASVDGHLPGKIGKLKASTWLDRYRAVQQATWHPAHGELLKDVVVADGGFVPRPGALVYNRYRPAVIVPSEANPAPWLDHLRTIYPGEAAHLIKWFAHRIQYPGEKINHALVLGGSQGIGKDTILEPVRRGVGPWNWADIDPKKLTGAFNPFVESVVLRINEARDLGDLDRFAFYDHSKTYIAAPPDVLMCNNKHAKEYPVFNVMGVILTTNHKTNGIYLPLDDRRHYVAWSEARKEDFDDQHWRDLWDWLNSGGDAAVVGYLRGVDLSDFNPKAPPPKTDAFFAIVQANANPDDVALAGITARDDGTKLPVVTLDTLAAAAMDAEDNDLFNALTDSKNRRRVPHMMERAGYVPVRNPDAKDGLWKIGGRRQVVYADSALSLAERVKLTQAHVGAGR